MSPEIQNEMIGIISNQVLSAIISKIKENEFFSLMVDETTDINRCEEFSFCVRFVDMMLKIHERFCGFWETDKTDGLSLFELVNKIMNTLGLSIQNIVGQCYDGASNMKGEFKGLSSRIKVVNNKAIYIHCYAHQLNLALTHSCTNIKEVRNAIGNVNCIFSLIGASAKRSGIFREIQKDSNAETTLKRLCETRWASRSRSFSAVLENFPVICAALKAIDTQDKNPSAANAMLLYKAIHSFEFVFVITLLDILFEITNHLSELLQKVEQDYASAVLLAKIAIDDINLRRSDEYFEKFWKYMNEVSEINEIDLPSLPRVKKTNKYTLNKIL